MGRAGAWSGAGTRSALCRGRIAVRWETLGGAVRVQRAQPRARGPTRPAAPPGLPQCPRPLHLPPALRRPHWARPAGRAFRRGLGVLRAPTSASTRLCCARSPRVGSSVLCLSLSPRHRRPPLLPDRGRQSLRTPARALFPRGGAEARLPRDTGWWAWCSPHCGLYGSPRRTKGVHAALVPRARPPLPVKDARKTLF